MNRKQIAALADRFGRAKAAADIAAENLDAVKADVIASGEADLVGDVWKVKVNTFDRTVLDSTFVKSTLTPAQWARATRTIDITRVTAEARAEAVAKLGVAA